jgi:hypothetical protein
MKAPEIPNPSPQSRGGRRRRLRTLENVRVFVAQTLRELEDHAEPGDPTVAKVKLYGAQILAGLIEKSDLERRVVALEVERAEAVQ